MKPRHSRSGIGSTTRLLPIFIVLGIVASAHDAWARAQKLSLRFSMNNEAARLTYPEATSLGAWTYVPKFGAHFEYEASSSMSVGIGPEFSIPCRYLARNASYHWRHGDLYAQYLGFYLPAFMTLSFAHGIDWSLGFKIAGGLSLERWKAVAFRSSRGINLPVQMSSEWYSGVFGRAILAGEARPANWVTLTAGPYVGLNGRRDLSVGFIAQFGLL